MIGARLPGDRGMFDRAIEELGWAPADLRVADGFAARLVGLLASSPLTAEGLPRAMGFPRCRSVHTWLMGYPLDIAFLDARGRVVEVHEGVGPGRVLRCPAACAVLERAAVTRVGCAGPHPAHPHPICAHS